MKNEKFRNNLLDFNDLEENHLSIQLSLDGFSFCIYDVVQQEIGALSVYKFDEKNITPYRHLELFEQLYNDEKLLQNKFKSVSVSHFNNLVSQVPQPFFNKNNLSSYLQYSIKLLENDFITYDKLKNFEIVNVYIPFVNINNFLLDTYGTFEYKHSSTIIIEKLLNQYKNLANHHCFINIINSKFEIIILKNNQLELFNCFSFNTKEDFIYYILFTFEQLNLNPEEVKLILLGDIEKDSELYDILFQYIRYVEFYKPSHFSPFLKGKLSEHAQFTLLNQL